MATSSPKPSNIYEKNKVRDDKEWRTLKDFHRYCLQQTGKTPFRKFIQEQFVEKPCEDHNPDWAGYWTPQEIKTKAEFRFFRQDGFSKHRRTLDVQLDCDHVLVAFYCVNELGQGMQNKRAIDWRYANRNGKLDELYDMHIITLADGCQGRLEIAPGVAGGAVMRLRKQEGETGALQIPSYIRRRKELEAGQLSDYDTNKALALDEKEWRTLREYRAWHDERFGQGVGDDMVHAIRTLFCASDDHESALPQFPWSDTTIERHAQFRNFRRVDIVTETIPTTVDFDCMIVAFLAGCKEMKEEGFEMIIQGQPIQKLKSQEIYHLKQGQQVQFRLADGIDHGQLARIPKLRKDAEQEQEIYANLTEHLVQAINQQGILPNGLQCDIPENLRTESATMGNVSRKKHECAGCGITRREKMSVCSRCKEAQYCSKTCQRGHWKEHKLTCCK